ncbi:hypothetical protein HG15A2_20990 [Adhaeretor mobilis]|uniref:Uncharacterized protein n=1 Tax=Adhaeretor mobilis TaxID=1930276 RepID=A0A517MV97_9BACT|nr:hypothetical protein HG15A2_20990 [Adhaeretor mobilis]
MSHSVLKVMRDPLIEVLIRGTDQFAVARYTTMTGVCKTYDSAVPGTRS